MSGKESLESRAWGGRQPLPQRSLSVEGFFKVLLKMQPLELGSSDLATKKTGCPVKFEFQTNNKHFLAEVCHF